MLEVCDLLCYLPIYQHFYVNHFPPNHCDCLNFSLLKFYFYGVLKCNGDFWLVFCKSYFIRKYTSG